MAYNEISIDLNNTLRSFLDLSSGIEEEGVRVSVVVASPEVVNALSVGLIEINDSTDFVKDLPEGCVGSIWGSLIYTDNSLGTLVRGYGGNLDYLKSRYPDIYETVPKHIKEEG